MDFKHNSSFSHRIKLRVFTKSDLSFIDTEYLHINIWSSCHTFNRYCFPGALKGVCVLGEQNFDLVAAF